MSTMVPVPEEVLEELHKRKSTTLSISDSMGKATKVSSVLSDSMELFCL